MAGKKAHKKSSGQLADTAVKARKAKRHEKLLQYFIKRRNALEEKVRKDSKNLSNSEYNRARHYGLIKYVSRPKHNVPEVSASVAPVNSESGTTSQAV